MIIFYDSSQIIFDECSVDKFGDKWRIDSICKCFCGVDKWRTKKIVNIYLLSLQKHKDILPSIPLQFTYNLLFYTILKHQIQPVPTLSPGSNLFRRSPGCIPGSPCRIWWYSPILPPRQAAKQRDRRPDRGDSKNYKLSDNFKKPYSYFTSTPSQNSPPPSHPYQKSSHFTYPSPLPSNQPF